MELRLTCDHQVIATHVRIVEQADVLENMPDVIQRLGAQGMAREQEGLVGVQRRVDFTLLRLQALHQLRPGRVVLGYRREPVVQGV